MKVHPTTINLFNTRSDLDMIRLMRFKISGNECLDLNNNYEHHLIIDKVIFILSLNDP